MGWKKNSAEAIRRFDEVAAVPGAERKTMFGCPVYQLHGERYAMLHENRVVLRLSTEHAAQLIAKGGRMWEPMPAASTLLNSAMNGCRPADGSAANSSSNPCRLKLAPTALVLA